MQNRTLLIELISVAVMLAIGIELMASQIMQSFQIPSWAWYLIGSFLIIIPLVFLSRKLITERNRSSRIGGFFIIQEKENTLLRINRYPLGERLYRHLHAAFVENPALLTLWNREPLRDMFKFDADKGTIRKGKPASMYLMIEAMEYFVLDRLSMHLSDYFNSYRFDSNLLQEFHREDIPQVLLTNRFLELFSRPRDQRPLFTDDDQHSKIPTKIIAVDSADAFANLYSVKVVSAFSPSGATYHDFCLRLPINSDITRTSERCLRIDTDTFVMELGINFDGFKETLPHRFEELYLDVDSLTEATVYYVGIDVSIKFKLKSLFTRQRWDYYEWIDSFIGSLYDYVDKQNFFQCIGWETALTQFEIEKNA